jgi:hypothetical protein
LITLVQNIIVKLELGINTSGFRNNAWASGIILSTKMSKLSSVTLKEIHNFNQFNVYYNMQ